MRHPSHCKSSVLIVTVMAALTASGAFLAAPDRGGRAGAAPPAAAPAPPPDEVAALKAEVARLRGMVPDQSHAMADVGYHFTNLYFAARAQNWPLAQFCVDEVRSHLRWAVRIIPVRKDREGREVDLNGILTALEKGSLKDLSDAVRVKDKTTFDAAYRVQMENCMACHRAASKEFIRLKIPDQPAADILDFEPDPAAK
jgi:hypothetical protein